MKQPKPTTIDFETFGIEGRPHYPPMPVGVSIKKWGKKAKYYSFGHRDFNNCCWSEAADALEEAYKNPDGILCQNGKFDVDVAEEWFGLPIPKWENIHDTMFLLFLDDPHQMELGLKEASERLLDWPAEEQDAVAEWLIQNQPVPGVKISKAKSSNNYFGRYLALAPAKITGPYANGDTDRTEALFKLLYPKTVERDMLQAYQREQELMVALLNMERQGLPVDLKRLRQDVEDYEVWRTKLNEWIIKKLKAPADINLNSGAQLMNAMIETGVVDESRVPLTRTGKYQTNKDALLVAVDDQQLLAVLKYRSQLNTCLDTFMIPWLKVAEQSNGLIFTTWNQVRSPKGDSNVGTRTGRLSSTPNFQNLPKEFILIFKHHAADVKIKKGLPISPFKQLPPLPRIRSYIIPFKGHIFIDRDYSQQEPRILAHFDGGALLRKYLEDPWIDFHDYAKAELEKVGKFYPRRPVKDINLGLIYGMGIGKLALKTGLPVDETKDVKKAVLALYPGLKEMMQDMKVRAANGEPIRTFGGREYYCEEPKIIDGRIRTFDYKMVNCLIQGSAADCTKEAIIRVAKRIQEMGKVGRWVIVLQVHDQLTLSVPKKDLEKAMEMLRQEMESIEFDVPMLSEGCVSTTNWQELEDYDVKGRKVA